MKYKAEDILKKKGITPATKHHDYNYLYKAVVCAMREYAQHSAQERFDKAKQMFDEGTKKELYIQILKALQIASGLNKSPNP